MPPADRCAAPALDDPRDGMQLSDADLTMLAEGKSALLIRALASQLLATRLALRAAAGHMNGHTPPRVTALAKNPESRGL